VRRARCIIPPAKPYGEYRFNSKPARLRAKKEEDKRRPVHPKFSGESVVFLLHVPQSGVQETADALLCQEDKFTGIKMHYKLALKHFP